MLAHLLNYKDRKIILRLAHERGTIQYNGTRVSFSDFSAEGQRRRSKYADVKKRLQHLQLKYAMLYPARLWVTVRGQAHFFETAFDVASWLDQYEQDLRRRRPVNNGD